MLNSAAQYLNGQAQALVGVRDSFNDACYSAGKAFGSGAAASAFNDFFKARFAGLDGQAETMGPVADATQQCAVIYDHAERPMLGEVAAMVSSLRSVSDSMAGIGLDTEGLRRLVMGQRAVEGHRQHSRGGVPRSGKAFMQRAITYGVRFQTLRR
jgi:hypothetical protein